MTVSWSNLTTGAPLTQQDIDDLFNQPPPPLDPGIIPAEAVVSLCRSGAICSEEAQRWLYGRGPTIFGGPKWVDAAVAALKEIATA